MTLRSLVDALLGRMQQEPSAAPAQQVAVASRLSQQFELPAQWVLQQEHERIAIFRNEVVDCRGRYA
ncbi:hypothetical protein [Ralstonia solanacearum]|uniref:Uncharacterized protein n=2 Tax=Ralstonia solanacearum TaxID=305 RepID=A0A5H2PPB5_RALSL|nr:hypothetical protein [Ralstonia solanacearum]AEG70029.1 conserved hypothetical protein [Ralstonia solanacearum Po82]AMP68178.1 hypothetical protein UW163_01155 [Ralstonia solanacearum]AMP74918.1 hypothetical protein RALBFv3_12405 [Ralstonia solanacearum]AYB61464.1 hypothetical protein C2124_13355 [Ralstonia solanacearum]EUJ13963.1 hypothetical protein RSP673_13115 [Ralstonia solanacearum P673]